MTPPGQGDAGEADPRLRAALESGDEVAVAGALADARVFVGVESRLLELADPADEPAQGHRHPGRPELRGEKRSEMVLATLRLPSGATALPVFSSAAALSAWRSEARPVPVAALDACAEAARLGHRSVVVDVAGPVTATLDVSALADAPGAAPQAGAGPGTEVEPGIKAGPGTEAGLGIKAGPRVEAGPGTEMGGSAESEGPSASTPANAAGGSPTAAGSHGGGHGRGPDLPGPTTGPTTGPATDPATGAATGLRPAARPWDERLRSRVAAELDALAAAGLARGARLWQADLVTGPGAAAAGPAVAVAVPVDGPDDDTRFDEIARRLRAAVLVDANQPAPAVVFVDATQAAALRGNLGRGLVARRWRRRAAPA
ncbi:hypothetical protein FraEuI1c_1700 [Pseudofrankia inefficax]|uniref:SseB protein N-terminal domain-containing protein n=2 Tax=Pseudofrankia inefficax (strain DSM 45817 / CECT 9037 / DDB 130130 / EuI1c) TaxID=298654 RepID=E3JA55_PSEI1|nr:hypothetical protein FraEuI1c_1700 [Pseudofrankia inefficax]